MINERPYKVGDTLMWGWSSCRNCPQYCMCHMEIWYESPGVIKEVIWGDYIDHFGTWKMDWIYKLSFKINDELVEEWVGHGSLTRRN